MKKNIIIIGFILVALAVVYSMFFRGETVRPPSTGRIINSEDPNDPAFLSTLGPGVNLAGAEFGPDIDDYEYNYPTSSVEYYSDKGLKLVRLPILWERVQPELNGELSGYDIEQIKAFLDKAEREDIYVILDLHNYGRYNNQLIGSSVVTIENLDDFWTRLSTEFMDHPAVVAYGVMNEPHDMNGMWPEIVQSSVDAIRMVDEDTIILVSGENWSKSYTWREFNDQLIIEDPSEKVVYEAHVYFDPDHSGKYDCSFDECDISLDIGEQAVGDFLGWLEENDAYGFIGEYGVPADDDRWLRTMDEFLKFLDEEQIPSTIWAGGPDWGDYNLSIEPTINDEGAFVDKPQIEILVEYLPED